MRRIINQPPCRDWDLIDAARTKSISKIKQDRIWVNKIIDDLYGRVIFWFAKPYRILKKCTDMSRKKWIFLLSLEFQGKNPENDIFQQKQILHNEVLIKHVSMQPARHPCREFAYLTQFRKFFEPSIFCTFLNVSVSCISQCFLKSVCNFL